MDEIRIYVAAATGALDAERELLADAVLPRLRERGAAAGRGIAWEVVDPEERAAAWSLKDRLRAIDGSPLFVAFVGERLGPPLPPPQADLLRRYPWLTELAGASLGEVEVVHGALVDRGARRSFLYLRAPDLAVPPRERLRFRAATREEAERLEQLKASLRASGQPVLDGYPCRWDAASRRVVGLETLADRLVDDLWTAAQDLPRMEAAHPAPRPAPRVRPAPESAAPALRAPEPPGPPASEAPEPAPPELRSEPREVEPPPDDATAADLPPVLASPAAPAPPSEDTDDLPATPTPSPEVPALGDDDIPPLPPRADGVEPDLPTWREADARAERDAELPLPPSPNPIVSSLPPLRGAGPLRRSAGPGGWLAVLLVLLALAVLVAWLLLRQ